MKRKRVGKGDVMVKVRKRVNSGENVGCEVIGSQGKGEWKLREMNV